MKSIGSFLDKSYLPLYMSNS